MKLGTREFDETKIEHAATRAAITTIAEAIAEIGSASTAQITALSKQLEGFKPETLTDLAKKVEELGKVTPANKPGDKPGDKPAPGGDVAEQLKALLESALKPLTEKVTAFETEKATAAKAAAAKEAVEKFVGTSFATYARKARLQRELTAFATSAEKIDEAALKREAERLCDVIAQDEGKKNHAEFVGANPPKKTETGGEDKEAARQEKLERLRKENAGQGQGATRPIAAPQPMRI